MRIWGFSSKKKPGKLCLQIKTNIINVLEDVDIGPGRSRVALVQYALQPSVVFGFDKYYSLKKGVERMSYTGGATMLSKALSFAAGLLYKEQNMKDVKKRKHKLMPTPRHDRLQVLCLVSDGASDDNIDKATAYLHEKLQIKVDHGSFATLCHFVRDSRNVTASDHGDGDAKLQQGSTCGYHAL
ncbi:von Willebrand factor type A domain protein [Ancylostoma caninum]|uniref:von Willebrand factor type A domain protein n=1 Tax=Ancylostoma caninum TaxID=29170 RepID=A0A368H5W8_ANCCA|nr:von Willebrand factor type A domain protein [Ancylostoma caninum]